MRILLIEDDQLIGDGLNVGLGKLGFTVDWFTDGLDGREALYQAPYEAVVLDLGLPGVDGLSILKEWRAKGHKEICVFFYEEWDKVLNHPPVADDLVLNEKLLLVAIHQPVADEFNWSDFFSIGFSHHTEIISKAKTLEARLFYIHECAIRYWSKYTLRDYLKADLYSHRGTLPNNFAQTLPDTKQALKAVCSFKDEYLLDFINVEELNEQEEDLDEKIVEKAIVANVKKFIMTFGQDFSFIGNQYRMEVAGEEMFIDLLFFNRELKSLVAVELKSGKFRTSYLGQLNTYLSALDTYIRKPHENPSIGIILCKEMNQTFVEFAVRDYNKPMGVATYRASKDMPERLRNALPNIEDLKKLL